MKGKYNAILLDTDNGPEGLTQTGTTDSIRTEVCGPLTMFFAPTAFSQSGPRITMLRSQGVWAWPVSRCKRRRSMHIATKEPNTICGSPSGSVEGRSVHRYSSTTPDHAVFS